MRKAHHYYWSVALSAGFLVAVNLFPPLKKCRRGCRGFEMGRGLPDRHASMPACCLTVMDYSESSFGRHGVSTIRSKKD